MTAQPELDFTLPSAPINGPTLAVVKAVSDPWLTDDDWWQFVVACRFADVRDGFVSPDRVRALLTTDGELTVNPRRLSAFYSRAASAAGFLEFSHWDISKDAKGRNNGKPARQYKVRDRA